MLLLEGHTVLLPTPKIYFASDICIDKDTPVFGTSKNVIKFIGKCNTTDKIENDMMAERWHVFTYIHRAVGKGAQRGASPPPVNPPPFFFHIKSENMKFLHVEDMSLFIEQDISDKK